MGGLSAGSNRNRNTQPVMGGGGGTSRESSGRGPNLASAGSGSSGGGEQRIGGTNTGGGNYQAPPPGDTSATSWMEQQAAANPGNATAGDQYSAFTRPTPEQEAEWKRASAEQAQREGKTKAQWMNDLYGTNFFLDTWGENQRETWGHSGGDDWYI